MKKIVYLCAMMLMSMNIMAQIDPYDRNWDTVVFDDFNQPNRQFDNTFQEPDSLWTAFSHWLHPSGVTKGADNIHQIYQWNHCLIDADSSVLKLCSQYIQSNEVTCADNLYVLPPPIFGKVYQCDEDKKHLYYYSGMIESYPVYDSTVTTDLRNDDWDNIYRSPWRGSFRYGYFEIKCKLPVHQGAFPAFWLWGAKNGYYETIDIFEYSWAFTNHSIHPNNPAQYGSSRSYINKVDYNGTSYCLEYVNLPANEDDLTEWHTFGCEWLPERVTFYLDGKITAEEREHVPSHYLSLKTTYAIDKYALYNHYIFSAPEWRGSDTMYIDYIKVQQLNWDCETDAVITCQSELDNFSYGVKKSINITSAIENVEVADTCKITFRATDAFEITGPFQTDVGSELTVIMQKCP